VDIANPAVAAKAQQDMLFAGVLYGIAGGLAAAWLVAGVTFLVTKAARTRATAKAPLSPISDCLAGGEGAAADHRR
jgi:hypothetical protein